MGRGFSVLQFVILPVCLCVCVCVYVCVGVQFLFSARRWVLEREELRTRADWGNLIPTDPNPINLGNAFCEKVYTGSSDNGGQCIVWQGPTSCRDGSGCQMMKLPARNLREEADEYWWDWGWRGWIRMVATAKMTTTMTTRTSISRVTMQRRPPDGDDDDGLTVNIDGNPKWWLLIFSAQPVLLFNSFPLVAQTSLHHCSSSSSSFPWSTCSSPTHSPFHNCKLLPAPVDCFKLQYSLSVVCCAAPFRRLY